mgnify:CR=1 FL=1
MPRILKITVPAFCLLAGTVLAADRISYDKLEAGSLGDATPKSLMGKTIEVSATRFGTLGFEARKNSYLRFACESGDKSLTAKKPKITTFEGTTARAQGWDGLTIWWLADCQVVGANPARNDSKAAGSGSKKMEYVTGNRDWQGLVTVSSRDAPNPKVVISTGSAHGTCDLEGTAQFSSPDVAQVKVSDEPNCKVGLQFTATDVKVKTSGCESLCGGRGPGFDYAYRSK